MFSIVDVHPRITYLKTQQRIENREKKVHLFFPLAIYKKIWSQTASVSFFRLWRRSFLPKGIALYFYRSSKTKAPVFFVARFYFIYALCNILVLWRVYSLSGKSSSALHLPISIFFMQRNSASEAFYEYIEISYEFTRISFFYIRKIMLVNFY